MYSVPDPARPAVVHSRYWEPSLSTYILHNHRRGPMPKKMQIESTIVFVLYVDTVNGEYTTSSFLQNH